MRRSIKFWQAAGFVFTSAGGTLLHFLHDTVGDAVWAAPFCSVNESTFEHMKLMFWPMFIFAVVQSFFFKDYGNFMCIKLKGTLLGIGLIPILFYTYNGVIGSSPDWINIAIFFICAAVAYIYESRKLREDKSKGKYEKWAFAILCAIALSFTVFTFLPPKIALFKDPLSESYGI